MLKKAVLAEIVPSVRICKCGTTVSIDPQANKTLCHKCGEIIYVNTEIPQRDCCADSADSE